jgi:carboxyl-terminal processing protease
MPNVFVPIDTTIYQLKLNGLIAGGALNSFVYNYYLQHRQQMQQYNSAADYVEHFNASELWDGFIKYPGASMDIKSFAGKEKEIIIQRLKALLARYRWRSEGFYQVLNSDDPAIRKALELVK